MNVVIVCPHVLYTLKSTPGYDKSTWDDDIRRAVQHVWIREGSEVLDIL